MKLEWTEETPRKIQNFPGADFPKPEPDLEDVLTSEDVDHVAEIFQTPLSGSYNWDYTVQDDRIKKLYDLGKQLNWDPEMDINWDRPWPEAVRVYTTCVSAVSTTPAPVCVARSEPLRLVAVVRSRTS